mgnify:CR=1 FL=1
MKISDLYDAAVKHDHESLVLLIDYLVHEKKAVHMSDDSQKVAYYLQPKFHNKMNEYLQNYKEKAGN